MLLMFFFYFPQILSCKDKKKALIVLSNYPSRLRDKKQRTNISKAISLLETHSLLTFQELLAPKGAVF